MRMPPKNFPEEIQSWRTAGYEPSVESLENYNKWNRLKTSILPGVVFFPFLATMYVWSQFFQGRAILVALVLGVLCIVTVWLLLGREWIGRRDAEDHLRAEYMKWRAGEGLDEVER